MIVNYFLYDNILIMVVRRVVKLLMKIMYTHIINQNITHQWMINLKIIVPKGMYKKKTLKKNILILNIFFLSVPNGKYMDEPKYINSVNTLDEPKYTSCHMEDQAIKHQQYTSNVSAIGCHTEDPSDVIKSEDTHNYVLPSFLH